MTSIIYLIGSYLSGKFYRLGGTGGAWYKSSWVRDYLCSLTVLAVLSLTNNWHWSLYLCYPVMVAFTGMYWKFLNPYFGKPKTDCFWFNYLAHGLGIGLALIPYGIYTDTATLVLCRAIAAGILMTIWSELNDDVDDEEFGRGAIIIITLLIITVKEVSVGNIFDLLKNHWVEIGVVYLAAIKFTTTIRDVIDKTPATDDNWFERLCTILNKLGALLFAGKRPNA